MRRAALLVAMAALAAAFAPASASAAFGLNAFDVGFFNSEGLTTSLAGSHPYEMRIQLEVNSHEEESEPVADDAVKDLEIAQVPGFVGDQTAVPPCQTIDFLTPISGELPSCPDPSAVGLAKTVLGINGTKGPFTSPLYFLEPSPGQVAKLGFTVQSVPVTIDIGTSPVFPYNIVAHSRNISQVLEFFSAEVILWGVPGDPRHDEERGACYIGSSSCPVSSEAPFITLPRACTGPLRTSYETDSWQNPGVWVKGFAETHEDAVPPNPQGMVGCGDLGFAPVASAQPTTTQAESSSGLSFELDVNDEGLKSATGRAQADIEAIAMRLPAGVTANPSAGEGLGVCTLAQYEAEDLDTPAGAGCPDAAKLGTVEATTPLLENHPLKGSLYLAAQEENPFGSLLAFYLVIRDPGLGLFFKQAGEVETDKKTGQIVSVFEELPPYPLSHVSVTLRSGPRAPLVTPPTCGTYETTIELLPSSGAEPLTTTSPFTVSSGVGGGPCPAGGTPPFNPGFEAGSQNPTAGRFSPFSMRLTRGDGEQDLTRFSAILPPGVTGKIAGIARCSDQAIAAAKTTTGHQQQANPSCPASSQLGHVVAGAGVGTSLTYASGSLYLAGPYNGDPLSVVAVVPAVAGPFDVGTIVTRVALNLNSAAEAEIDGAASDPIPHILKGIPLKVRDIRVYADRPGFTLNPTSCAVSSTRAQIFGSGADVFNPADDIATPRASRYQASSCASLAFKPKLTLKLNGGTKRNQHPELRSTLVPRAGDANIKDATVTLPHSEFIDPLRISNPCTRVQFAENACPPGSVLGQARAFTPLLDEPLEGPVYFRSNGGERKAPDIVADLKGQFEIVVVGAVDSVEGRIRTRFFSAADAPVTKFLLNLKGGKEGVIVNSANLCRHQRHVKLSLTGHNGRLYQSNPVLQATGCKAAAKKKRRR